MNKTKHTALVRLGAAALESVIAETTAMPCTWQAGAEGWR